MISNRIKWDDSTKLPYFDFAKSDIVQNQNANNLVVNNETQYDVNGTNNLGPSPENDSSALNQPQDVFLGPINKIENNTKNTPVSEAPERDFLIIRNYARKNKNIHGYLCTKKGFWK